MTNKQDQLQSLLKEEFYSPYRLAKLESVLRGKEIPPQKLYGYVRQGYIQASVNSTGKLQISRTEAEKHLKKYIK